ncbi:MAG TPA: type III-B CRISPR-associated protein Cas10/Cmr2, partial [Desulfobacterales bacterium]|nr:type III-B CRISPR-associated protein Cas10/Cmr2 [Desulfobacterales bacterium]
MTFQKSNSGYWERKFIAYMHDSLDKILQINGHGDRAALSLEKFGLQKPNEQFWKKADAIAAGFERGQVPSYSPDENKNGAVDFLENPIITHPTSEKAQLKILFTCANTDNTAEAINQKLMNFIETNIGMKAGQGGYSDEFKGDEDRFAVARFLYTHLTLRFKLAENNVGGIGSFWHRMPADTRFPDHSIWQHNALCSAINSCIELARDDSEIGIMVFSITPVQQFIAKARKLRDYWTGSVLLSWLSFEGMRWIIENLGPDHIIYPSLIDQPLVNEYLKKNWKVSQDGFLNPPKAIASFPNKFLFLIPMNHVESIAGEIKSHIQAVWIDLYERVCATCITMLSSFLSDEEKTYV